MREGGESTIRFISKHMAGFNEAVAYVGIISVLMVIPGVAVPILNQILIDNVLSGLNPEWGAPLILFAAFFTFMRVVLRFLEGNAWRHRMMMITSSSSEMLWHILRLPVGFFHDKYTADISNRIYYGTSIADKMTDTFVVLVLDVVNLFFYVYFMIRYSAILSIFAILHVLCNLILFKVIQKKQKILNREAQKEIDHLSSITAASIENIDSIKSSTAEPFFFRAWGDSFARMQSAAVQCASKNVISESVPVFLDSITRVFILGVGTYYIIDGYLTVGMLMSFQAFATYTMSPLKHFVSNFQNMAAVNAQTERMKEILDEPCDVPDTVEPVKCEGTATGKLIGDIELRHVTFGYDRSQPPIIEDFNMVVPVGKSVAFVGPSGCGKSTIAKLISGLYKPWSGEILFNGKHQDEIDRDLFANSVAIVDQNIVMFEGDISDNVKLWDESVEDFAMILACHDAQIHDEIAIREGGYHANMESGGKNFSGGQRQRIELASAFAKEPTIMIMDEGTSALDAITEEGVMNSIRQMGCSQIIIAHRLSTIRDCDEIIVMQRGKIVERGTHEQLMAQKGFYSLLIENK